MKTTKWQGVILDLFDTVVVEDTRVFDRIVQRAFHDAEHEDGQPTIDEASKWILSQFTNEYSNDSSGEFKTEIEALRRVLTLASDHWAVQFDVDWSIDQIIEDWSVPTFLPSAERFFEKVDLPICILSDADNIYLKPALSHLGLSAIPVVSSEDCRAYKPATTGFEKALSILALDPSAVVHIGNSTGSDGAGAAAAGVDFIWINAQNAPLPPSSKAHPTADVKSLSDAV
jgi:FMN phosphatase YigB (HAD superfamily)